MKPDYKSLPLYVTVVCDTCGKVFQRARYHYALHDKHYCCNACYGVSRIKEKTPKVKKSDRVSATRGHKKGGNTRKYCVYTVYDNYTDEAVAIDATAEQAAKAMNIATNSFYGYVKRTQDGKVGKWWIEKTYLDGEKLYA
ncbi:MAG: hypothetical protein UGF89_01805 [Acutalibacteraceae bacterium]|nr:hypothetical protein [Acutalibacteraceae bacterium]